MHGCQKKGENLQEFNFEFSEIIQAVTNCESKDIIDLLKMYMCTQKLFNLAISSKTIWHAHPTLQTAIHYVQQIEREWDSKG